MGHDPEVGGGESTPYDVLGGKSQCREALDTLYWYLDGELTSERRVTIRHHLEDCSPCLGAFDFEAELKAVIAKRCRDQVPDALRRRVAEALADASGHAGPADGHDAASSTSSDDRSGTE